MTQTEWKTGKLPKPGANQILMVNETYRIGFYHPREGRWENDLYRHSYGRGATPYKNIPYTKASLPTEWSIITYEPIGETRDN